MINNRYKSVVRDMKWTGDHDGQKICIVFVDGECSNFFLLSHVFFERTDYLNRF